jgi:hypothetical protein
VAELRGGVSGGARRRGHRHIDEWWPVAAGAELGFRDRWQGVTPGGGQFEWRQVVAQQCGEAAGVPHRPWAAGGPEVAAYREEGDVRRRG